MIFMPTVDDVFNLEMVISSLREKMIQIGIQEGLNSENTIKLSQELDHYILKYQSLKDC